MGYDVQIAHESGRHLAVTRFTTEISRIGEKIGPAFQTVAGYLAEQGIAAAGPAVAYYETGPDEFKVAAGFFVAEPIVGGGAVQPFRLPDTDVATTTHMGAYEDLVSAYDAVKSGALDQGREVDESTMWEEYWTGPEVPAEQIKTVVYWPLKPA